MAWFVRRAWRRSCSPTPFRASFRPRCRPLLLPASGSTSRAFAFALIVRDKIVINPPLQLHFLYVFLFASAAILLFHHSKSISQCNQLEMIDDNCLFFWVHAPPYWPRYRLLSTQLLDGDHGSLGIFTPVASGESGNILPFGQCPPWRTWYQPAAGWPRGDKDVTDAKQ